MQLPDHIPFAADAQRSLERMWLSTVRDRAPARGVRPVVRASWERSLRADVAPHLAAAPVVLDEGALHQTVERSDWLGIAREAVERHQGSFSGVGHILTLFDHEARMLAAEGDPAALEGLGEINFRPGGLWTEAAVGTNGPGTALATGQATHIVGAEHFCARWHRWHCAAVPVRDPASGGMLGVLDISGFREQAHPHTLNLALALVVAIEQTLAARETRRRYLVLSRLTELALQYPTDATLAVDRAGWVLLASATVPPAFRPGFLGGPLRQLVPELVAQSFGPQSWEVTVPFGDGALRGAVWYPVLDGAAVVGGCLLLERQAARRRLVRDVDPSLEEPGQVEPIARELFARAARQAGISLRVEPAVFAALAAYRWPGGVRELANVVRRLVQPGAPVIRLTDLPRAIRLAHAGMEIMDAVIPRVPAAEAVSHIDQEDQRLMDAVNQSGTMAEAAARLGITRSTLYRRMARYGLAPKRVMHRR